MGLFRGASALSSRAGRLPVRLVQRAYTQEAHGYDYDLAIIGMPEPVSYAAASVFLCGVLIHCDSANLQAAAQLALQRRLGRGTLE